jgi:hypothetical protein
MLPAISITVGRATARLFSPCHRFTGDPFYAPYLYTIISCFLVMAFTHRADVAVLAIGFTGNSGNRIWLLFRLRTVAAGGYSKDGEQASQQ